MSDVEPDLSSTEDGGEELPELSDYGRRFVEQAPEEERQYAEKYVRQWDGGYKKAVEKYETELNQWRQLGDFERAQNGTRLLSTFETNPQRILEFLTTDPDGPQLTVAQAKAAMKDAEEEKDPYAEKLTKLERAFMALAQDRETERQTREQERQRAAFEAELDKAAKKYGEFDVSLVAGMIAAGKAQTIDEAVQHYHRVVGKPQRRATPPNLLGASSAAPSGAKKMDFGKAEPKEVVNYLTHLLSAGNE